MRGVASADVAATRRTLLAIIENLALDEVDAAGKQLLVPSTRALGRLVAGAGANKRGRNRKQI